MPTPFLSSEEYDERAHQLYNEGLYEEALDVLREGLALYPNSVELHIGVGYARLAREEFAWARLAFEKALILDPDHEDALAGMGETLLKFGRRDAAERSFRRILELGYSDDIDLILQVGRACFRDGMNELALEYFEIATREAPDLAEAQACIGYAQHAIGNEEEALIALRRALQLDDEHAEARIYLANILFDRNDHEGALYHLELTSPDDHWQDLGIFRLVELMKAQHGLPDDHPELRPWHDRLVELTGEPDEIDLLLAEVETLVAEQAEGESRNQLELFGVLLSDLAESRSDDSEHHIETSDGQIFAGSWDEIVRRMRDADMTSADHSVEEFMRSQARRAFHERRVRIPADDPESFIRASASAGLLRIVR
jgi:tetratricopeptide (TPR) repeat protein